MMPLPMGDINNKKGVIIMYEDLAIILVMGLVTGVIIVGMYKLIEWWITK